MAIPKYDQLYNTVLDILQDGIPRKLGEIIAKAAASWQLTEEELQQRLPSGVLVFKDRVSWACSYLLHAEMIARPAKATYCIAEAGKKALKLGITVDNVFLRTIPCFQTWVGRTAEPKKPVKPTAEPQEVVTPLDAIDHACKQLDQELADELLRTIMDCSPAFFERLVVKLLLAMGYGDDEDDAGIVVGRSGDEGIDGVIREDKLGFRNIYIQAKRWNPSQTVSRPDIQQFIGALSSKSAATGLFITTAHFSQGAKDFADQVSHVRVVLVDGERLARLMMKYGVGVSVQSSYVIHRIDSDFFLEDET